MSTHKHKFVIKTTNRLEYWFTCDNCGKDIMMTKWDFWDLKYYDKQALVYKEAIDSWAEEMRSRNKAFNSIWYPEVVTKEFQKTTRWERFLDWARNTF